MVFLLTALIGIFSMTGPNPATSYGSAGSMLNHNEQGGRQSWKIGAAFASTEIGGDQPGVSCGLATKNHSLDLSPGTYTIAIEIDGDCYALDDTIFDATYQRFSYHVNGTTYATVPASMPVPHNEQGSVYAAPWIIDASVLNSPSFGVWFEASVANDGEGFVRVYDVKVIPTRIN